MPKFFSNLNLNGNELQNSSLEKTFTHPSFQNEGVIFYNQNDKKIELYHDFSLDDSDLELGAYYRHTGNKVSSSGNNRCRTKNPIQSSKLYNFHSQHYQLGIYCYDQENNYLGMWGKWNDNTFCSLYKPSSSSDPWYIFSSDEDIEFSELRKLGVKLNFMFTKADSSVITTSDFPSIIADLEFLGTSQIQDLINVAGVLIGDGNGCVKGVPLDTTLSISGAVADAYQTGYNFYRTKDRTLNIPLALTYWDQAESTLTDITPADCPINTWTEVSGAKLYTGFLATGLTLSNSDRLYAIFILNNMHNRSIKNYFIFNRTYKEFYWGRSTNSGTTVTWYDWSPSQYEPLPKKTTITTSTTWTGNGPYTQTISSLSSYITDNSKIDIQLDATAIAALASAGTTALYIENNSSTLTLYALGAAPSTALTLQVVISEVSSI